MKEIYYFMVGMPSGGKTSYIVRLCSQLIMDEFNMVYKLADRELPDGLHHIREQMDKMDGFQKIMRTFENVYYDIKLPLIDEKGEKILLMIPDLSGEHYRKLVEDRYILKTIYDGLQQADVILFFINTETMEKEERLNYDEKSATCLIEESLDLEKGDKGDAPGRTLISEKATQSQVVELLQILLNYIRKKVQIKFVISAWDRVEKKMQGKKVTPEEYLKDKLPLLYQYMRSNLEKLNYEVFGVSAQGAEYDDQVEMRKLQEADIEIGKLVKVVMPNGMESQDMSILLRK